MAKCPNPTLCNFCLGFTDLSKYTPFRPERSSKDWGEQGIYAIMERGYIDPDDGKKKEILYVGRGNIGERLERHFRGTDGQAIGNHLKNEKYEFESHKDRFKLKGIKVYWKRMCEECNKKREESFIECVEASLKYRPPYNIRKGNAVKEASQKKPKK